MRSNIILKVIFVCLFAARAGAIPETSFSFGYPSCALCSFINGGVITSDSNYSEAETAMAIAARRPVSIYHV
jgi:hypothetical protein